ncbi:TraX family protein [Clostridium ihumii]|uniref:TraX family protein n=1 Tax=Clostridium ihumii TaxID=1470356 RepID=UPI00058EE636|nr:TraX family protein [Clostridium ihumii]
MDVFTLKILAIICMVLDHVATNIPGMPVWFHWFGKLASPIFFYFIVEGFFYTRSKTKYMGRLFGFSILMIGVDLIFNIHNNIFLSLGTSILLLTIIEYTKNSKKYIIGIPIAIIAGLLGAFTEASLFGVGMTLIFYFFREKKIAMSTVYILFSLLITGTISIVMQGNAYEQLFINDPQWMMIFSIIPILLYNGKRGVNNKFTKYLFYIFYPAHLIIICTIAKFIA